MCAITASDKQVSASMQGLADKEVANVDSSPSETPQIVDAPPNNSPTMLPKQQSLQSEFFVIGWIFKTLN